MATAQPTPHPLHLLVPRLGTDEQFAAFREILRAAGYDSEGICLRLGIPSITEFQAKCDGRTTAITLDGPIDALLRLFLDGEYVEQRTMDALLPAGGRAVLEELQVVARDAIRPDALFATITLYPAEAGLMLAGDRPGTPDGSPYEAPPDVVYPGVVENTRDFLATLPETPCEALLDLGTGSGVAALSGAKRYARQAWGLDIADRSVRFAEFNRRLNGIDNATILASDLYDSVRDLTFDRIVTHPPYVPAAKISRIFADGGADGEEILRRAIEGLPRHLRGGGRFYSLVLGADCEGQNFEDRIRLWLGAEHGDFDLVMISHSLGTPTDFLARSISKGRVSLSNLQYWAESWARRKVLFLFYGTILLYRHGRERGPITMRVQRGTACGPEHAEWLLDWTEVCASPGFGKRLLAAHPVLAPDAELRVLHRLEEGRFAAAAFSVESQSPFNSELRCAAWLVAILSECKGDRSWRDHYQRAVREDLISAETSPEEFGNLLGTLVGQGILRIPEHPLPDGGA
jgi:carbamoyltransferase